MEPPGVPPERALIAQVLRKRQTERHTSSWQLASSPAFKPESWPKRGVEPGMIASAGAIRFPKRAHIDMGGLARSASLADQGRPSQPKYDALGPRPATSLSLVARRKRRLLDRAWHLLVSNGVHKTLRRAARAAPKMFCKHRQHVNMSAVCRSSLRLRCYPRKLG